MEQEKLKPEEIELEKELTENYITNYSNFTADNIASMYKCLGNNHHNTFNMIYKLAHDIIKLDETEWKRFMDNVNNLLEKKYHLKIKSKDENSKLIIEKIK